MITDILFYITFVSFAVFCDTNSDTDVFVVERFPDDVQDLKIRRQEFKVYWNVPTMQCRGDMFHNLSKYGIIQNNNDKFIGEMVSILYDPGYFPALLKNGSRLFFRNGGVPQEGDLNLHLDLLQKLIDDKLVKDFNGIGIIDFESWRPIYRQNFGELLPYKNVSIDVEKQKHWVWPSTWITQEAIRRFEESAKIFMESSLNLARNLRPLASWGYYAYPYCFNMNPSNMKRTCADGVIKENDRLSWLWRNSDILFPSIYVQGSLTRSQQIDMVKGRIYEAQRNKKRFSNISKILPYFWFKYRDNGYFTEGELKYLLDAVYTSGADGLVIWGSSNDVNTKLKCGKLEQYVRTVLGPMIKHYTTM